MYKKLLFISIGLILFALHNQMAGKLEETSNLPAIYNKEILPTSVTIGHKKSIWGTNGLNKPYQWDGRKWILRDIDYETREPITLYRIWARSDDKVYAIGPRRIDNRWFNVIYQWDENTKRWKKMIILSQTAEE